VSFGVCDQHPRLRRPQDLLRLADAYAGSQTDDRSAAALDGDHGDVDRRAVLMPEADAVSGRDAEALQIAGQVCGCSVEIGPGEPTVGGVEGEVDVGGSVRRRRGVAAHAVGQGGVRPPACGPILRCFGARHGDHVDAHHQII
jgi:hypothetical protein